MGVSWCDINDPRAHHVHRLIGEMISIDTQPFCIVDNEGFTNLLKALEPRYSLPSTKYMTETVLPRIMAGITACVKLEMANVKWFSFTTDIWSTDISSHSLLSLTAHWLTDSFERKSAVLHAQSFPDEHTGETIYAASTKSCLKDGKSKKSRFTSLFVTML